MGNKIMKKAKPDDITRGIGASKTIKESHDVTFHYIHRDVTKDMIEQSRYYFPTQSSRKFLDTLDRDALNILWVLGYQKLYCYTEEELYHASKSSGEIVSKKGILCKGADGICPSVLELACLLGDEIIVKCMLDRCYHLYSSVNYLNGLNNALLMACERGHLHIVCLLIVRGAKASAEFYYGEYTPLHVAVNHNNWPIAEQLLLLFDNNSKVDEVSKVAKNGMTALHIASQNGHLEIVKHLVEEHEANIFKRTIDGKTAADIAKNNQHKEVADYLHVRHRIILTGSSDVQPVPKASTLVVMVNTKPQNPTSQYEQRSGFVHRQVVERTDENFTVKDASPKEWIGENKKKKNSDGEDDENENMECSICMDAPKDVVFIPCGHVSCCQECSADIHDCPICRQPVTKRQKLFFA